MLSVQSAKRPDLPPLSPRRQPSPANADTQAAKPSVAAVPPSPRPAGTEGLDQWFQDLQKYEVTLGAMAAASEDPKFREELGTIEQWFKLLSESEQTATLYTLLQHANQGQAKFMSAVLHQMSADIQPPAAENAGKPKGSRGLRPPSLNIPLPGSPAAPHFNTPATSGLNPEAAKFVSSSEQAAQIGHPGQDLTINTNWDSEVKTPLFRMFPPGGEAAKQAAANASASGVAAPAATQAAGVPGMPIPMMNPFNMAMLNNMGFSNEAQILAVQMVMSGLIQPPALAGQQQPKSQQPRQQKPSQGNWRTPTSAKYPSSALRTGGLRSAVPKTPSGLRSSALRSATPLASAGATPKEADDIDPELIKDVPAWMKSLRLHKYNHCFDGLTWQDMVELNDEALEAKGVVALGARRRLLKTFDLVRKKMGMEPMSPTDQVPASAVLPSTNSTLPRVTDEEFDRIPQSAHPAFASRA